jgi:hypothetical protein
MARAAVLVTGSATAAAAASPAAMATASSAMGVAGSRASVEQTDRHEGRCERPT